MLWPARGPAAGLTFSWRVGEATTLPELMRYVAPIRRMLNQGAHYAGEQVGSAVYVYTKTCDDVYSTAKDGATWQRKQIIQGRRSSRMLPSSPPGAMLLTLTLSLKLRPSGNGPRRKVYWRWTGGRRKVTVGTVASGSYLTARRKTWSLSTGITVRVRWHLSGLQYHLFLCRNRHL